MSSAGAGNGKSESVYTTSSGGTKRKRNDGPKFYAVRTGFNPGIYHTYKDCLEQVRGFKAPNFKSFPTLKEAEGFMKGLTVGTPSKFYGVQNGRVPGVYTDWPTVQAQITGWTKPKQKVFATRAEAEAFVRAGTSVSQGESVKNVSIPGGSTTPNPNTPTNAPPFKKSKKTNGTTGTSEAVPEPGTGLLPPGADDRFDNRIFLNPRTGKIEYKTAEEANATKLVPTKDFKGTLRIFTDGSSLGNGALGAVAGVGVYFGPQDPRNLSEPLAGSRQTNQRAELTALLRALELAPLDINVEVYSDSNYSINCVTVWHVTWRKNGWVTSNKKPVENRDLVEEVINKIEARDRKGVTTKFVWIKGHANFEGNVQADRMAVDAARRAKMGVPRDGQDAWGEP
ncbi:ribonuclease H-like protein [Eremomyces bilateralis CBS 781.70]|uniref:ribonuclease H n=1 Tax=Eremomyces bilateralis CBS 781.70 TaxID=1392243 RepID=A0A6G1FWT1_9PEZI|nr:ribonuclease H-like protein [Eremomyces bilateralis CBS 781.70]KAF1810243.1 ribonuclease H-like protein [Eremomyces bilateralis CBS 781.70]